MDLKTYSKLPLAALVDPLKKAKLTGEGVEIKLGDDLSEANIRSVLAAYCGIDDFDRGGSGRHSEEEETFPE